MDKIIEVVAELNLPEQYEPPILEAVGDKGDIKLTLKGINSTGRYNTATKIIDHKESLDSLRDVISYPATITPNSHPIEVDGVKMAYFDNSGYLVVEHEDSTEQFKVQAKHRGKVFDMLKKSLGNKFKS
jgi:hypothetical protein